MNRKIMILPLIILMLVVSACASAPKESSIVIGGIHPEFLNEDLYQRAKKGEGPFGVHEKNALYQMMRTGIAEGVTLEDVRLGLFVLVMCSCGAGCYGDYPVLLPKNVSLGKYDLIEIEVGSRDWRVNKSPFTLSKFRRHLDIDYKDWPRIKTDSFLPTCIPANWPK